MIYLDRWVLDIIRPAIKAPVISATPKNCSAQKERSRQKTKAKMTNRRISLLYRLQYQSKNLKNRYPNKAQTAKNAKIFPNTKKTFTLGSAMLVITVSAIIPRISSMMAAPRMALPALVLSLPISLSVSTVILTEVAVKITPIKIFCSSCSCVMSVKLPLLLKRAIKPNPKTIGTITPRHAIIRDALPDRFRSFISVSNPAVNINTITPSSDN